MIWSIALWFMFVIVLVSSKFSAKNYNDCSVYKRQSPINLLKKDAINAKLPPLSFDGYSIFDQAIMDIMNNGHTVEVKIKNLKKKKPFISGGSLHNKYEFEQFHLHWNKKIEGSEHHVDGINYATEIHIVHYNTMYKTYENAQNYPNGLCVVAIFGKISSTDNPDLNSFISELNKIPDPQDHVSNSYKVDFSWISKIVNTNKHFFAYDGSLTTSPYTECVKWIILEKPLPISNNQVGCLRMLHSDTNNGANITANDRCLQPLCGREVYYQ